MIIRCGEFVSQINEFSDLFDGFAIYCYIERIFRFSVDIDLVFDGFISNPISLALFASSLTKF